MVNTNVYIGKGQHTCWFGYDVMGDPSEALSELSTSSPTIIIPQVIYYKDTWTSNYLSTKHYV